MCQTKTDPKVLIFRTTQKKIQRSTPSELGERAFLGSETGWGKSTFPTRLYEDAPSSFKGRAHLMSKPMRITYISVVIWTLKALFHRWKPALNIRNHSQHDNNCTKKENSTIITWFCTIKPLFPSWITKNDSESSVEPLWDQILRNPRKICQNQ